MIITSGRDLIRYIQNNKLEDYPVGVGCEGYSNDPKDLDTDISVDLTYDGRLLIHDNGYYDELERGEIEGSTMHKFAKYSQGYIKASSVIAYPWVTVEFHGEIKAYGSLKDDSLVHNIMEAMRRDDAFAKAMSDLYNPEYTTMEWDYSIYEEIALGIVDFCKADYREWEALKSRGREDGDWVVISEDESIVIS